MNLDDLCPFCHEEMEGDMCRCGAYKVTDENYDIPYKKRKK